MFSRVYKQGLNRHIFRMKSILMILVAVLGIAAKAGDVSAQDRVTGRWLSEEKDGVIEVSRVGDSIEGKLVDGNRPNDKDVKNPDKALQSRSLMGVKMLGGFHYDKDGRWEGGTIYDPNSGKTYDAKMQVEEATPNEMKLRGYVLGIPFLGRTTKWTRVAKEFSVEKPAPSAQAQP